MDAMDQFNGTDARVSRTINNPLLNLVIAASILSKITHGKAYQSPWVPFRPIFGYYPHQPLPSLWYPIDPFIFPSRIYSSLTTNVPQLQAPPLNQQQIIHIHEALPLTGEGSDASEDNKNKYTQNINNYPEGDIAFEETDPSSSNVNEQPAYEETNETIDTGDQMVPASSNTDDIYEPVELIYDTNDTLSNLDLFEEQNDTINEIPEPLAPYGIVKLVDGNRIKEEMYEITTETQTAISLEDNPTTTELPVTTSQEELIDTVTRGSKDEPSTQEIKFPCTLDDHYQLINDLEMAEANSVYKRKQRPQINYDYDYYEDDYVSIQNKRRQRPPSPPRRTQRPPRPFKTQPTRINSKRGQYRPVTIPTYDDDYDYTTPRAIRREPTQKGNSYRRRTTPTYDFDDYEELRPVENRRKPMRNSIRRTTTPVQDDYYDDDDYENEDYNVQHNFNTNRQKVMFRPRQGGTSSTDTSTTSTTTTTEGTTDAETAESSGSTGTGNTGTMATQMMTSAQYPYYGSSGNGNISFTYGPPINQQHPGYGPSNGNEHISITYGPPTGQNLSPLLDSWYNQYAKSSVLKRIQELLAPNNFYSPQYDGDKFNYNDNVF